MPVVYAAADLHGNLPPIPDDADVVLLAGDICPDFKAHGKHVHWGYGVDSSGQRQARWLDTDFRNWLTPLVARGVEVAACWGNHDYVGEKSLLVPDLPWTLLKDQEALVGGLRVWGTPWVPKLPRWAFYARPEALTARAELIPEGLDVLMTHGPPHRAGDFVPYNAKYAEKYGVPLTGDHAGDSSLNEAIDRVQPRAVICGHIHEARGTHFVEGVPGVPVYNVAAVDETYTLHREPFTRLYEF